MSHAPLTLHSTRLVGLAVLQVLAMDLLHTSQCVLTVSHVRKQMRKRNIEHDLSKIRLAQTTRAYKNIVECFTCPHARSVLMIKASVSILVVLIITVYNSLACAARSL